jgi:hypothetical protein
MYYTIYQITNKINGKIYIGLHKTDDLDDSYMGSGKALKRDQKKFGMEHFEKEILHVFDNPDEMIVKEQELVNEEFVARKDTYNIMLGGVQGWKATQGTTVVKDSDGNCFRVPVDDPRILSGEFKSIAKGTVVVRDNTDIEYFFVVSVDDPRYISGELLNVNTGAEFYKDPAYREKISVGVKKAFGEKGIHWIGKKHSDSTKQKMSQKAKQRTGDRNSQYGTMWIHNVELKECKKIKKDVPIPDGWEKGRKMKF